ncbi:GAF domain-containing protein [Saccharopolyspora sp. HNM0983]|uniref:GAF domain-containing protein n=2 Tax=Saccharopolyspora montiporae TaxID=2781240 RepID=A0A929BCZ5_9PSEU|nr:GAF domain-containing protein [Saccharopolyspora sp. HNM0983]MBE9375333.1 GAF domain-containing protein [Saccharopolyspora sp. HNM0983]
MRQSPPGSADPLEQARMLERVHGAVLSGEPTRHRPRAVVFESWRRSLRARVDPDGGCPPVSVDGRALDGLRDTHPLRPWVPLLQRTLLDAADGAAQIMIITDAAGNILWRHGDPHVCRDADRVCLAEGTRWAEEVIGTNAMGTALATGGPVQIHSAEHLVRTYHSWTCAACPVHDPETGALLGTVDLSGPLRTMHPALPALVAAAARLVEGELRLRAAEQDRALRERSGHHLSSAVPGALLSPSGRVVQSLPGSALSAGDRVDLDDPAAATGSPDRTELDELPGGYLLRVRGPGSARHGARRLELGLLGENPPTARIGGRTHRLSLRHAEILTVLALHPGGLDARHLALLLHGERGNPVTVRAEVHRLRGVLGADVLRTRPYRLQVELDSDLARARGALDRGQVGTALRLRAGDLLPDSESPAVRDERDELRACLRSAVLDHDVVQDLWEFAHSTAGHADIEVLERLAALLPPGSARLARVRSKLDRLVDEDR